MVPNLQLLVQGMLIPVKKPQKNQGRPQSSCNSLKKVNFGSMKSVNGVDEKDEPTEQELLALNKLKEQRRKNQEPFIYNHEYKKKDKE